MFDLAGTTVDDGGGAVLRCLVETAREYDLPGTPEELNDLMGLNKREVFGLLAERKLGRDSQEADGLANNALVSFADRIRAAYEKSLAPLPGVEDTFRFLRKRGIKVATDTGFDSEISNMIVERLDWPGRLVDVCVSSSDVPRGRPAPYMIFHAMSLLGVLDVHCVMKIGDSPSDLQEGWNAGCVEVIGVLSGAHTATSLGRVRHTRLIDSVADLPSLFA